MRLILIDAEKLKKTLPLFIREEADAYIDEAEEVEAIPNEWIEKKYRELYEHLYLDESRGVRWLLRDWREENERNV